MDVPMLMHGPEVEPRREETPVSLVDVAPTLLELAGSPVPTGLDGRSLGDLLEGAPADAALASRPLYRRDLDPLQRSNLASSHPGLEELRGLAELRESVAMQGSSPDEVAGLQERLRSLGY